jgi:hypothetical protein
MPVQGIANSPLMVSQIEQGVYVVEISVDEEIIREINKQ